MLVGANWPYDPKDRDAPDSTWAVFHALNPTCVVVPSHISYGDVLKLTRTYPDLFWFIRCKGNKFWLPNTLDDKEYSNEYSPIELVQQLQAYGVKRICVILLNEVDLELTPDWKADDAGERLKAGNWYLGFANQAIDRLSGLNVDIALSPLSEGGPPDRFNWWWMLYLSSGLLKKVTRVADHCYFPTNDFGSLDWGSRYKLMLGAQLPIDILEANDNGQQWGRPDSYKSYLEYVVQDHASVESINFFTLPGGVLKEEWWAIDRAMAQTVATANRIYIVPETPSPPVVEPSQPPAPTLNPWEFWTADQIALVSQCDVNNVRQYWPTIHEALTAHKIASQEEQAGIIGTVAIETASTFKPIDEYLMSDGSIPAWWYNYDGGPTYHGRGFIQLTHAYNYRAYGTALGFDLLNNPDQAKDPFVAAMVLARYCADPRGDDGKSVAQCCIEQDWTAVRKKVQGGTDGLDRLVKIATGLLKLNNIQPEPTVDPKDAQITSLLAQLAEKQEELNHVVTAFAQVADIWVPQMVEADKKNRKALAATIANTRKDVLGAKPQ